jgi:hypothetical protein
VRPFVSTALSGSCRTDNEAAPLALNLTHVEAAPVGTLVSKPKSIEEPMLYLNRYLSAINCGHGVIDLSRTPDRLKYGLLGSAVCCRIYGGSSTRVLLVVHVDRSLLEE